MASEEEETDPVDVLESIGGVEEDRSDVCVGDMVDMIVSVTEVGEDCKPEEVEAAVGVDKGSPVSVASEDVVREGIEEVIAVEVAASMLVGEVTTGDVLLSVEKLTGSEEVDIGVIVSVRVFEVTISEEEEEEMSIETVEEGTSEAVRIDLVAPADEDDEGTRVFVSEVVEADTPVLVVAIVVDLLTGDKALPVEKLPGSEEVICSDDVDSTFEYVEEELPDEDHEELSALLLLEVSCSELLLESRVEVGISVSVEDSETEKLLITLVADVGCEGLLVDEEVVELASVEVLEPLLWGGYKEE
ncbi:hypothetical protein J3R30DRAFT_3399494 [Lentinula aciculospora]|uniref:Uncharacterized protein n=1 Tax=Lentinula aciculospora TaxID=153920 RepID=A0A9W9DX47_9AGAR|nr:hypothetical protein J3R30DRAFT_3399494 [Lentinula aciculospora]